MVEVIKLVSSLRRGLGSAVARRLRKSDKLPAVIYGAGFDNIFIEINTREFEKEYLKGGVETKIFEIEISSKKLEVICHRVDLDPRSDRPRHVDFLSLENKKEIRVLVPLVFKNMDKSPGLKRGGYFNVMVRKLPLICPIAKIPKTIEINCEDMKLKQSVKLSNLDLPEGSRAVSRKDVMLARIIGRGREEEEAATQATASTATSGSPGAPAATGTTAAAGAAPNAQSTSAGGHATGKK
ncbi:MAG: 50S ribosomal protein L25/general stress protein Ctc [Rickettsiales bacterium]|jgi:large subunit ribosomal protein L25|nr:50S ribosomal protein L25/general stress protein Ctc [Rickettsiales bacterium]